MLAGSNFCVNGSANPLPGNETRRKIIYGSAAIIKKRKALFFWDQTHHLCPYPRGE